MGHKTSQCVLFMDLLKKALKEGRLQFGEKPKPLINMDSDPIQTVDIHYVEPLEILMVEAIEGLNMEVDKGEQISDVADADRQHVYPL